ncbi:hypothetical protein QQ045_020806 [Rhodiola kirilowii]
MDKRDSISSPDVELWIFFPPLSGLLPPTIGLWSGKVLVVTKTPLGWSFIIRPVACMEDARRLPKWCNIQDDVQLSYSYCLINGKYRMLSNATCRIQYNKSISLYE